MAVKNFHVKDLLSLSSLDGIRVLAGAGQLGNIIQNINVMEVPDVWDWVQKDEFLMTTGYMYRNHSEHFLALIPKLKERGIAALGIKPNRYIHEIPPAVISCADHCGLPLLALPEQTAFSLVIREVMEKILLSDLRKEERLVHQLIHSNQFTSQELHSLLASMNITHSPDTACRILLSAKHEPESFCDISTLKHELYGCLKSSQVQLLASEQETTTVFLCLTRCKTDADISFFNFFPLFADIASRYGITFFMSEPQQNLLRLHETYEDVQNLFFSARSLPLSGSVVTWQSLGIYSAVPLLKQSPFHRFIQEKYILPITDYDLTHGTDLLDTLHAYIRCNGNMRAAAKSLYIHYNTMCYRINLIREHFSLNLSDIDELTCIRLAFLLQSDK